MSYQTDDTDVDVFTPVSQLRSTKAGREQALNDGRTSAAAARRYEQRERSRPPTKWEARQFIAWDGEGVTVKGVHRYVVFANSLGGAVVDRKGVPAKAAFDLLLSTAERNPLAVHVVFAGGYDVNMLLKSAGLRRHQARILADTGRVTLDMGDTRYRITYHPRHTFEIAEEEWNGHRVVRKRYMCLWDVFGSYQSSFVKACRRTLPDKDLVELDAIEDMKGKRGDFRLSDIPQMLEYCRSELKCLVRLCEVDADSFEAAGFRQSRYDGAGAKATAVLQAKRIRDHKSPTPDFMTIPSKGAYAGGRIECARFGRHTGPLFTVDLRSAYPWAATHLPSLAGGTWTFTGDCPPSSITSFSVFHVRYSGKSADDLHPFFWRGPDGRICYPQRTEGWYWAPEVYTALQHAPGTIDIVQGMSFEPFDSAKPFAFIPELYEARRRLEEQVRGRGWPLKLALNSLYGKLAQQIGGKDGKPPRYHQLEWAGWITSRVRASMYNLAYPRKDRLVSIQTDGITFTGAPDSELLSCEGRRLGDLEIDFYDAGVFVQSGIYWLHDAEGWHDPKVRGVGAGVLSRGAFEQMWDAGDFGGVPVEVTRFRGLITSSLTDGRWGDWCQWVKEPRDITAAPQGKRIHIPQDCPACRTGQGLHTTLPTGGGVKSSLHTLAFESKVGRTTADEWWLDTLESEDSTPDDD